MLDVVMHHSRSQHLGPERFCRVCPVTHRCGTAFIIVAGSRSASESSTVLVHTVERVSLTTLSPSVPLDGRHGSAVAAVKRAFLPEVPHALWRPQRVVQNRRLQPQYNNRASTCRSSAGRRCGGGPAASRPEPHHCWITLCPPVIDQLALATIKLDQALLNVRGIDASQDDRATTSAL